MNFKRMAVIGFMVLAIASATFAVSSGTAYAKGVRGPVDTSSPPCSVLNFIQPILNLFGIGVAAFFVGCDPI